MNGKRSVTWRRITVWTTLYRSPRGEEVTVTTLCRPKRQRVFRSNQLPGRCTYKAVKATKSIKELILVAKSKKKNTDVISDDELEELESLEELEDVDEEEEEEEDEEEPEDEEEDEDEDDEEEDEPVASKSRKAKKAKQAKAKSDGSRSRKRPRDDGRVGTAEVAAAAGVEARDLRMVLRKHREEFPKENGNYSWPSLENRQVKKLIKMVQGGAVKAAHKESLDKLKDTKSKKSKSSKDSSGGTKKRRKKSAA